MISTNATALNTFGFQVKVADACRHWQQEQRALARRLCTTFCCSSQHYTGNQQSRYHTQCTLHGVPQVPCTHVVDVNVSPEVLVQHTDLVAVEHVLPHYASMVSYVYATSIDWDAAAVIHVYTTVYRAEQRYM